DAAAAGLDTDEPHVTIVDEGIEDPHGVAAAPDARHDGVRQASGCGEDLRTRLLSDHRLKFADHERIWMRTEYGSEEVITVGDIGDPVAHRLVDRVLERAAARVDGSHLRAEQAHPEDVERL